MQDIQGSGHVGHGQVQVTPGGVANMLEHLPGMCWCP